MSCGGSTQPPSRRVMLRHAGAPGDAGGYNPGDIFLEVSLHMPPHVPSKTMGRGSVWRCTHYPVPSLFALCIVCSLQRSGGALQAPVRDRQGTAAAQDRSFGFTAKGGRALHKIGNHGGSFLSHARCLGNGKVIPQPRFVLISLTLLCVCSRLCLLPSCVLFCARHGCRSV